MIKNIGKMTFYKLTITYIFLFVEFFSYSQSLVDDDILNYKINGNVKSVIEIGFKGNNKEDTIGCPKKLSYGKNGKLLKADYCVSNLYFDYVYVYDKKGNVIYENTSYDKNENTFDDNGNLIEHKSGVTGNEYFGKWIYKYDKNNNQIERIGYIDNDFIERWIHKYDQNNRRIEEIMVDENIDSVLNIKRTFEYDDKNNIIRQLYISYSQGKKEQWEYLYKYDIFNNITEYITIDNNNKQQKITYKYKYDSVGNWIEKTSVEKGVIKNIYERKILYYK